MYVRRSQKLDTFFTKGLLFTVKSIKNDYFVFLL